MNLFDKFVTEALKKQPQLSPLRMVVEKELLHHDILRMLSHNKLLTHLTFIGGTCLRYCYGGVRLSENLDFTGGKEFTRDQLSTVGQIVTKNLSDKYGLLVQVSEPIKDKQNVDTWKIKVITRPQQNSMPTQRINITICSIPSYEKRPVMLLNPYGLDMGTSGLIVQAQSREEIYTDKLLAFAFRPNRIMYCDIWDIVWLHGQGVKPRLELLPLKLEDRQHTTGYFLQSFEERIQLLTEKPKIALEFKREMHRFLPAEPVSKTLGQENLWSFITFLMTELYKDCKGSCKTPISRKICAFGHRFNF